MFQPELNKKSKRLQRNQSIGELLYDDAMRRINDRKNV